MAGGEDSRSGRHEWFGNVPAAGGWRMVGNGRARRSCVFNGAFFEQVRRGEDTWSGRTGSVDPYIKRDYSIIDDRIIFCIYSILLTTYVCTSYDTCLYCFVWQNRTARLQIWTANLYLRSYLFEFVNYFSELYKWYTVGKLRKIRNFFMLKLFSNFQWFKFNFENRKHSKTRLKRIFHLFSKPQIRITHMIRHLKATKIAQLCYLCKFFQIRHGFWTILKILKFRSIQKGRTVI
jgi:hypothetical protein